MKTSTLASLSVSFLAAPYVFYFIGWLQSWAAILFTAILAVTLVHFWRLRAADIEDGQDQLTRSQVTLTAGVALAVMILSGIGGVGAQTYDWEKNNTIFFDLIIHRWPVKYETAGGATVALAYYFAYFLPAAAVGKLLGWTAANVALFFESWAGLSLVLMWILVLVRRSWWALLLFLAFSGLDAIGYILTVPVSLMMFGQVTSISEIEVWSLGWAYQSPLSTFFWTSGHALAAWLGTSLLLDMAFNRRSYAPVLFLGLLMLWSPFAALGLLPLAVVEFLNARARHGMLAPYRWLNAAGALIPIPAVAMYLSRFYPLPEGLSNSVPAGLVLAFAQSAPEALMILTLIMIFLIVEVGAYVVVVKYLHVDERARHILTIAVATLIVIPFWRYGYANDFVLKTPAPALFVLCVIVGQALASEESKLRPKLRQTLVVLLAIGAVTSTVAVSTQLLQISKNGELWHLPQPGEIANLWELDEKYKQATDPFTERMRERGEEFNFLAQYISSTDAPPYKLLTK